MGIIEFSKDEVQMLEEGMMAAEIGAAVGRTAADVNWYVAILGCCDAALGLIAKGHLGPWAGYHLARLSQFGQMKVLRLLGDVRC